MNTANPGKPHLNKAEKIINLCCGLLLLYNYYQGIQKYFALASYRLWLEHAPVIKSWANILEYIIPATQLIFAVLLFFLKTRRVILSLIILTQVIFIGWVAYVFYATPYLFWPYHALWLHPNWFQKFMEALIIAWVAMLPLLLRPGNGSPSAHFLFRNKNKNLHKRQGIAETL